MLKLCIFVALCMSVNALATTEERVEKIETRIEKIVGSIEEILNLLKNQNDVSIAPSESSDTEKCNDNNLEQRVQALELQKREESDSQRMNDTDLEVRVQVLEFLMGNVQVDLTAVIDEVADLEEDVETNVNNIEAEQLIQDQRILNVEGQTDLLEADITDLRVSDLEINLFLNELQQNGTELDSRLDELESLDVATELSNLDSRLDDLELSGTVAFHVTFSETLPVIPIGGVAVWDVINLNFGNGYNSVTGEFVVPSGGTGLYYFYIHFLFDNNEVQALVIRRNGDYLCEAFEDNRSSSDFGGSSCGAVVELVEGDIVDVFNDDRAGDDTPCEGLGYRSTFSGFRIAPQ